MCLHDDGRVHAEFSVFKVVRSKLCTLLAKLLQRGTIPHPIYKPGVHCPVHGFPTLARRYPMRPAGADAAQRIIEKLLHLGQKFSENELPNSADNFVMKSSVVFRSGEGNGGPTAPQNLPDAR